jgi:NAD(P)-dependent dehydrogenase (short-subunit alcohol dehydrogenase family)
MGVLTGLSALVTGGGGGLGGAAAMALARDGASVALFGRTVETLEHARKAIAAEAEAGSTVACVAGDARSATDVQRAVDAAAALGRYAICVSVVGGAASIAPLLAYDDATFVDDTQRQIVPAFLAIKYSAPAMVAGSGGSIVCISSDAARLTWPFMAGYCAGKAGLEALVRVAAEELGHLQIRVNAVRPGLVQTDSVNSKRIHSNESIMARFRAEKPLGRTGTPADVAPAVRYLAGPESSWVTGQSFAVEGGNELRKAPDMSDIARERVGADVFDAALNGQILRR